MSTESPSLAVEVEDAGPCSKLLKITVPAARVDKEIEQTFRSVQSQAEFPGFRRGKVPRRILEARLGTRVLAEVKERLIQAVVDESIQEKELKPIGNPQVEWDDIEIAKGNDLAFEVGLDVRPEFELPDLATVQVQRPSLEITDEHVDAEVEQLRAGKAEVEDAGEDPLEENGVAELGVTIRHGDVVIIEDEDIEWQHPSKLLGGIAMAGLAESLEGKKADDEVRLTTTLPEDFRDEAHRGAEVDVVLAVRAVKRVKLPDLDDEFIGSLDYDDLEEMRDDIRKQLRRRAEAELDQALDDAIVTALLDKVEFDVPPSLVDSESGRLLRQYEMSLRQQGLPEEDVVKQVLAAKENAEDRAKTALRANFVLDQVATGRKVFVTENEVQQELASMAGRYNRSTGEMETYVERNGLMPGLRSSLRERKTLRELRDVMKIVDTAKGEAE